MKKLLVSLVTLAAALVPAFAQAPMSYRVDTIQDMLNITLYGSDPKAVCFVGGSATRGDGYGGLFFYNGTSTAATNVYSVFKPGFTTTGRWILTAGQTWNQAAAATAGSESTYAFHLLRNAATNVFSIGADNNNVYLQSQANYALHLNNQGNNTILNATAGNVGIGTTGPTQKLHLLGGMRFGGSASFTTNGGEIGLDGVAGNLTFTSGATDKGFRFLNSSTGTEFVTIAGDGNVGIGTTAPLAKLAINGGLHVGGTSDPGDNNAAIDGTLAVTGNTTLTGTLGVGGGTAILKILTGNEQLAFPSIDANGVTNLTMTVTGAGTNSAVFVSVTDGAGTPGITVSGYVSATNTVTVRAANPTVTAIDPVDTISYRAVVFQY